jgi:anti-anti-sigma factor
VGLATEELDGGITKVVLDGSLDLVGAAAIDLRMNLIGGSSKTVLIDMQKVTFIGSMGLRALVQPARAISRRGGKIAIFAPQELVEKVLATSGIDTMIPIFHDYDAAVSALQ